MPCIVGAHYLHQQLPQLSPCQLMPLSLPSAFEDAHVKSVPSIEGVRSVRHEHPRRGLLFRVWAAGR